jgi:hypothetical protein
VNEPARLERIRAFLATADRLEAIDRAGGRTWRERGVTQATSPSSNRDAVWLTPLLEQALE